MDRERMAEAAEKLRDAYREWDDTLYGKDALATLALMLAVQNYAAAIAAKQEN